MIKFLMNFISNRNQILSNQKKNKFQPMPASFGLVPELANRIKDVSQIQGLSREIYKSQVWF